MESCLALRGVKTTNLSFTCSEIMFILVAFMKKPKNAVKAVVIGTGVVTSFYMITMIMVIGALSVEGVVTRTWPGLDLMRSFEIPGLIFERFESFLLVIWIMQLFATFIITFYAASWESHKFLKRNPFHVCLGCFLLYISSLACRKMKMTSLYWAIRSVISLCIYLALCRFCC